MNRDPMNKNVPETEKELPPIGIFLGALEEHIVELRKRGSDPNESEVETCLNALYGVMLLRLQKREISPDTQHAINEITTLIGMLSDYYQKDKTEGLEFEE